MAARIELARGVREEVSNVRMTRSRDGSSSTATFLFDAPNCIATDSPNQEILGLFMIDEEGELVSRDVKAKFLNGKSAGIEARYVMRGEAEWERFLRFMNRYAEATGMSLSRNE